MTVLVTGARGNVGRYLVDELLDAGVPVRVLTRDKATAEFPSQVEVCEGDLNSPETLREPLAGVAGLHLLTIGGESGETLTTMPQIAELALESGVERVTVVGVGTEGAVEEAIRDSGLSWTFLQPMEFMSNTLGWAQAVKAHGVVEEAFPDTPAALIDPADVGAVAARALRSDAHAGKTYYLSGSEVLTMRDKAKVLSEVIGREIRIEVLPAERARDDMRARGVAEEVIDYVLGWHADPPARAYTVDPALEQILGRPATTFRQWAQRHAADFG